MDQYGISKLNLKRCNRRQILRLIRINEPISRVEISKELGITRAAITIITNKMIEEGILKETGNGMVIIKKNSRGRKRINLSIAPNFKFVFGVVIEKNLISIGLSNLNGEVLGKRYINTYDANNLTEILTYITSNVREIIKENSLEMDNILALGFCIHSSLIYGDGADNIHEEILYSLKSELKISVYFDELSNGLALAESDFEFRKQAENKPKSIVHIYYGDDITASFVQDGNIFDDRNIKAVGFGHMICETKGDVFNICDRDNCLNGKISVSVLQENINKIYSKTKTPKLYKIFKDNCHSPGKQVLYNSYLPLDDNVVEIIKRACKWFAIGISNTIAMLGNEKIVLFGKIFENESVFKCIKTALDSFLTKDNMSRLILSNIPTRSIFLAGCSIAIKNSFINNGGYES